MITRKEIAMGVVLLLVGGIIGWSIAREEKHPIQSVREGSTKYAFINPLLFVETPESSSEAEYKALKEKIETYIETAQENEVASDVSVYFRNLNVSQWVGINREETFSPASMLKVVTLISVLRAAESDPSLLTGAIS